MAKKSVGAVTLDVAQLRDDYDQRRGLLERLAVNTQQAIKGFLEEASFPYLDVSHRVKEFASLAEKVGRKGYSSPFDECEDLCGLRVICYFPSDVDRIASVIQREFLVHSTIDKGTLLGVQEFGYRSTHFIVSVKKEWEAAPNYRGLAGLKAEIQVRTLLMHAWAEVEHKLAYKSESQVPDEFRRRFSRLSAKFEEADEQFEELRDKLREYRRALMAKAEATGRFDINAELNLDSLQALLDFYFPNRTRNVAQKTGSVLEEITNHGLTMQDLVQSMERGRPFVEEYEHRIRELFPEPGARFAQVGALRAALDITVPGYAEARLKDASMKSRLGDTVRALRERVRKTPAQ